MFGKLMSISDELMWKYYALLTDLRAADIQERRDRVSAGTLHPKAAKADLAMHIVGDFHSPAAAAAAAAAFEQRFASAESIARRWTCGSGCCRRSRERSGRC